LVNGEALPYSAFSAGEQAGAMLLLRLVTLSTATTARFSWIDEPLEHLDPSTRRLTAAMLAQGGHGDGIRQLVVTTYEEELARDLARADDGTGVVFVRTQAEFQTAAAT